MIRAPSAAAIAWPARALGLFSRMLRQPEFTVAALGTGLSAHDIETAMDQFRTGARNATLMNRIAKGFSDDELRALAEWAAAQK
jgi:cytochrome c553